MCDLNLSDVGIEEGDGMIGIFWTKSFIKNVDCGLFQECHGRLFGGNMKGLAEPLHLNGVQASIVGNLRSGLDRMYWLPLLAVASRWLSAG